ncbi:MAG: integrase arm-type DNA-binding domain-containing protein [Paracoccaceae bacterium]|jgi:integrase
MTVKHRLTYVFIKSATAGKYSDGSGLWLHKRPDGGAQWFLRISINAKRREMGLGGYPGVSLKTAREAAERWRAEVNSGKDPIRTRQGERRILTQADNTLSIIAEQAFEARKAELKEDGKAGRWFTPIKLHVLPKIGSMPIEQINQTDIKEALSPIWHTKADTARKAMNRLNLIFKYALAMGLDVDINAVNKAKVLLGRTRHEPKNIPALHWQEVPEFYASLSEPSLVNLAIRLLILTGVRSKPLRFMRLEEVQGAVWTIPSENMKGRKGDVEDFNVPLSTEALNVIDQIRPFERDGHLFPNVRKGVMSDATMSRLMERRGLKARPHGFRSSLRTWLAECTDAPHEVCETVLAHVSGTSVQRAYRRTDFLEQRAVLMERWSQHVLGHNTILRSIHG